MSALTSLFTSMANKIRSKVGGSNTYTPTEMVSAIDDVYDAGVASATTPITPSNSSPASMTSGTGYKPTANGVAVSSVRDVDLAEGSVLYPSHNDVMRKVGTCIIVGDLTNITPSNSSPVSLTAYRNCRPSAGGYAIESYTSLQPTNINPTLVSNGEIIKATGNGYLISTYYSTATASDTDPPVLAAGYAYRSKSGGYFYKTQVHLKPGRVLFTGVPTAARTNTSWTDVTFSTTSYDPSGTGTNTTLDPKFGHIDNGNIVVDYAIPTAYLAGYVMRGVTSSGSAVYGGVQILKNGSVISGASCYGNSSTASPSFRRITTSFAVGDIIKIQTRVSSTTQAYIQPVFNIQWEG